MPNRLELPPDLLPLIEKREQSERRDATARSTEDAVVEPAAVENRRQAARRADDPRDG